MLTAAFIGTYDPFHGAHLGQLLRAYHYKSFTRAYVLVDKHPSHKPNVTDWKHRIMMAELGMGAVELPFEYEVLPVEDSLAHDLTMRIDFKVTGIESLLENLSDPARIRYALRWPMIVLSIPGIPKQQLDDAIAGLASADRDRLHYEYVDKHSSTLLNYNFTEQRYISDTIVHSSYVRSGRLHEFLAPSVREYIRQNSLYAAASSRDKP